jgi:hypothetical protein
MKTRFSEVKYIDRDKIVIRPKLFQNRNSDTNPKKTAIEWLENQISGFKKLLSSKGKLYFYNGSNYHSLLKKEVESGKKLTARVLESFNEMLELFPQLKKSTSVKSILAASIENGSSSPTTTQTPATEPTLQQTLEALKRLYKLNQTPEFKEYIDALKRLIKLNA